MIILFSPSLRNTEAEDNSQYTHNAVHDKCRINVKALKLMDLDSIIKTFENLQSNDQTHPKVTQQKSVVIDNPLQSSHYSEIIIKILNQIDQGKFPVNEGFLYSTLALKASEDLKFTHGRIRALSKLGDLALELVNLNCSIAAFLAARVLGEKLAIDRATPVDPLLAETKRYVRNSKSNIDAHAFRLAYEHMNEYTKHKDVKRYLETMLPYLDIFAVTDNKAYQWLVQYSISIAYNEVGEIESAILYLLRIVESFLHTSDADAKATLNDEFYASLIASVVSLADELILSSLNLEDKEKGPENNITLDSAIEYSYLTMNAVKKLATILGKEGAGAHFPSLWRILQLEVSRPGRVTDQILDVYADLIHAYPAIKLALKDNPEELKSVNGKLESITFVIFSKAFVEPFNTAASLKRAERSYELALKGVTLVANTPASSGVFYRVMWAELLLRNRKYANSLEHYETIFQNFAHTDDGTLLSKGNPEIYSHISLKALLYNRIGLLQGELGDFEGARTFQLKSRETTQWKGDFLGEIRSLISLAYLDFRQQDLSSARIHIDELLNLIIESKKKEEQEFAVMPSAVSGYRKGMKMTYLLEPTGPILKYNYHIHAIRSEEHGNNLLSFIPFPLNPEIPFLTKLLEYSTESILASPDKAIEYIDYYASLGTILYLLGDPLKAKTMYEKAEQLAHKVDSNSKRAELLYLIGKLYLEKHRYYEWFENGPKGASSSLNTQKLFPNIPIGINYLKESYKLAPKGLYNSTRLATVAKLIAVIRETKDTQHLEHWVDRGIEDFSEYKEFFTKDERFATQLSNRMVVSELYTALKDYANDVEESGEALYDKYDFIGAMGKWKRASFIYHTIDDNSDVAKVLLREAAIWKYLDKNSKVVELLGKSITTHQKGIVTYYLRKDHFSIPDLVISPLGKVSIKGIRFGRPKYNITLDEIKRIRTDPEIPDYLSIIGAYLKSGHKASAKQLEASISAKRDDNLLSRPRLMLGLGLLYLETRHFADAVEYFQQALAYVREHLPSSIRSLGGDSVPIDRIELDLSGPLMDFVWEARAPFDQADMSFMKENFEFKVLTHIKVNSLSGLGRALYEIKSYEQAISVLNECLELSQKYNAKEITPQAYYTLALVHEELGDKPSFSYLSIADSLANNGGLSNTLYINIKELLGRYHFKNDNLEQAIAYDSQATQMYEAIRAKLKIQELQSSLMTQLSSAYERLVLSSVKLYHRQTPRHEKDRSLQLEQVFKYIEGAKSRALLDVLGNLKRSSGDPTAQRTDLQGAPTRLRIRIEELTNSINTAITKHERAETIRSMQTELDALRKQYEDLLVESRISEYENGFFRAIQPIPVSHLQAELAKLNQGDSLETLVVEYFITQGLTIILLIRENSLSFHSVEIERADLVRLVQEFIQGLDTPMFSAKLTDSLYNLLLGKIGDTIRNKRVVIVPHGILHDLPFAALRNQGRFLIETTPIVYVSSASVLPFLFHQHTSPQKNALVFCDPDGSLPFSQLEASSMESIFDTGTIRSFCGRKANIRNFRQYAQGYSFIHLATHAHFNRKHPVFSSLLFSDGGLLLSDITRMQTLNANLVALSACNTARNIISSGDELIGLSAAFMRAGAPSLLVSLWNAEDESVSLLMKEFYNNLIVGSMPKDVALQTAQRTMIQNGFKPVSWAGVVLIGKYN